MNSFAVIKTGGKQYIVEVGKKIVVDTIPGKEKEEITFPEVLLYAQDEGAITIGQPYIKGATVKGEIIQQGKGEKLRVARFRAKSRSRKVIGFRPQLTEIKITKITV